MKLSTKILAAAIGGLLATAAAAQSYPVRPIRILVGYPAGISIDIVARLTAAEWGKRLGGTVVVENLPGASGNIAVSSAVRAQPDGYTLVTAGGLITNLPTMMKEPTIMGKDLQPVGDIAQTIYMMMVRSSLGIKTFQELVAYSKANPGKLNFGSTATITDLLTDYIKVKSGLDFTPVRYRAAPVKEMITGEVDFYTGVFGAPNAFIEDGRILPILFLTKHERAGNVPTAVDLGLMPSSYRGTIGFYAPMGTPREVVQKLSSALRQVSETKEFADSLRKAGQDLYYTTPEQALADYKVSAAVLAEAARIAKFEPQ